MPKHILFTEKAWDKLEKGIDTVANATKITLGSDGKYVVLEREWGGPVITNDGVTIARDIELVDAYEELGAKLIKEIASKTNEEAGDGTTTAIILAQSIFKHGISLVRKGINRSRLRRGINKAVKSVKEQLDFLSKKISNVEELKQIATLSASGDRELGELIATAIDKVGVDGAVLVEDSRLGKTELEFIEGYKLKSGVVSPYMIFDQAKQKTELEDSLILITDRALTNVNDFAKIVEGYQATLKFHNIPMREVMTKEGNRVTICDMPLVIFADDISRAMLAGMVRNNIAGLIRWVGVKTPATIDKKEVLTDLALKVGGKLLTRDSGEGIDSLTSEHFGRCKQAILDKNETVIIGGNGIKEDVEKRIDELKEAVDNKAEDGYSFDRLKERLANLKSNIAVIRVGASTPTELTEKKFRIEDAINSAKAALEEGVVSGAGTALMYCSNNKPKDIKFLSDDEKIGFDMIYTAIRKPAEQILLNADIDLKELRKLDKKDSLYGFNTETRELENLMESGIIDPVKVTRSALEYSASTIGTLLLSDVIVVRNENREERVLKDADGRFLNV